MGSYLCNKRDKTPTYRDYINVGVMVFNATVNTISFISW